MDDVDPTVPAHLRPVLGRAAEQQLEAVTDGFWPDDLAARRAHRDALMTTAHTVDNWEAGCPTREEVILLARRAIEEQQPADWPPYSPWPDTMEAVDDLIARTTLTRDLIQLRDTLGYEPT
ncbi:hypothetical protein [Baekduia sp. Peel2402]|uniref:hypothetical protein n=1 Tax=Baekduia sp. Peel2402 TaxID=3458296 RepID=UPI00403E37DC